MKVTKILLPKDAAAITWSPDKGFDIYLPKQRDDEQVSTGILVITACAIRLKDDQAWCEEMLDWMYTQKLKVKGE